MAKIELNTPSPDFTLDDFTGRSVNLAGFCQNSHVLLVFNRGFV